MKQKSQSVGALLVSAFVLVGACQVQTDLAEMSASGAAGVENGGGDGADTNQVGSGGTAAGGRNPGTGGKGGTTSIEVGGAGNQAGEGGLGAWGNGGSSIAGGAGAGASGGSGATGGFGAFAGSGAGSGSGGSGSGSFGGAGQGGEVNQGGEGSFGSAGKPGGSTDPMTTCVGGCERQDDGYCGEGRITWACFGSGWEGGVFENAGCEPQPTQVPRFCCDDDTLVSCADGCNCEGMEIPPDPCFGPETCGCYCYSRLPTEE